MGFTYADTFAGVGGFAAALEALGGESAYVVEFDPAPARVYEANWGHRAYGDITLDADEQGFRPLAKLAGQRLGSRQSHPQIDLLTGGFPCQPFSKSGAQRGMDETRGTLFWNLERVVHESRPAVLILENVRNIAGPRHRHEWQTIIRHLRDAGYQVASEPAVVSPHQISPLHGGTPQVRERVFITATLVPHDCVADPEPDPISLPPDVRMDRPWNLVDDLGIGHAPAPGTDITADERRWIDHWDSWVQRYRAWRLAVAERHAESPTPPPGHPIWANVWVPEDLRGELWSPGGVPAAAWKRDFLRKNWNLFDEMRRSVGATWMDTWLSQVRTFPESRQKLEWQAQDAESVWDCVISFRPSGLRVKRMTHLPALVAITQTPVLGPLERRLSTREAARLQGLPDEFTFAGQRDALTYKQLGNGVCVGVVWNVLKAHCARDRELLNATDAGRRILDAVDAAGSDPRPAVDAAVRRGQERARRLQTGETVQEPVKLLV